MASWAWDFSDGFTSNNKNAIVRYVTPGNKSVRLISRSNRGCADTLVKNIFINPLPNVVATGTATICWNAMAPLNASGALSYKWIPGSTLNDSLISNPLAGPKSYPNPQKYIVYGSDINNCVNKDSVLISFFPKPPVNAGPDTSVCLNKSNVVYRDSVQLKATGAINYVWTPFVGLDNNMIPNPKAKPKLNTEYVVEGTDINGCKVKDTITVFVLDPSLELLQSTDTFMCENDTIKLRVLDQGLITIYTWSPNKNLSNKNERSPFFYPKDTTTYILSISNYCYTKADTVRIDVRKKPPMIFPRVDSICVDQTYQINIKGTGIFNWRPNSSLSAFNIPNPVANPIFTTTYNVTLTDIYSCRNKDSLVLNVFQKPIVQIISRPRFVCFDIPFQPKLNADNNDRFAWTPNKNINDSTLKEPLITPKDSMIYAVEATNSHGCKDKDSILLKVQKPIVPIVPSPVHICENSFIFVEASGGLYYRWSPGYMINDTLSKKAQIYVNIDTFYKVYIANDCFIDSGIVKVIIDTLLDLKAEGDTTIYRGSSTTIRVQGDGSMEWFPNYLIDNSFSNAPIVSPFKTTKYYVKSINKNTCVSYDSVTVTVIGKTVLLLPTGFSPNGDGVNDLFGIIKYLNIEKLNRFDIYDRWGEKVFTTQDINAKWDGTYNGEKLPIGTFIWYVNAKTYDGEAVQQKGNITLLK